MKITRTQLRKLISEALRNTIQLSEQSQTNWNQRSGQYELTDEAVDALLSTLIEINFFSEAVGQRIIKNTERKFGKHYLKDDIASGDLDINDTSSVGGKAIMMRVNRIGAEILTAILKELGYANRDILVQLHMFRKAKSSGGTLDNMVQAAMNILDKGSTSDFGNPVGDHGDLYLDDDGSIPPGDLTGASLVKAVTESKEAVKEAIRTVEQMPGYDGFMLEDLISFLGSA